VLTYFSSIISVLLDIHRVGEYNQGATGLQVEVGKFLVDIIRLEVDIIKFERGIIKLEGGILVVVKVDMCQEDINNLLMLVVLRDRPTATMGIIAHIEDIGVVAKRIEVRPNLDKRMAVQLQQEDIQDKQEVGSHQELVLGIMLLVRGILDTEELGNHLVAIDLRLQL
jgi:hypothetical protein